MTKNDLKLLRMQILTTPAAFASSSACWAAWSLSSVLLGARESNKSEKLK